MDGVVTVTVSKGEESTFNVGREDVCIVVASVDGDDCIVGGRGRA
jgi:chorismate synthase